MERNKCRICFLELKEHFFTLKDNPELVEMLESLGGLQIEMDYPQYLCDNCEVKLKSAYEFQQIIKQSHEINHIIFKEEIDEESDPLGVTEVTTENPPDDKTNEQKGRLEKFSDQDVFEVINEHRAKIRESQRCFLCGFISANTKSLRIHLTLVHRDKKDVWCVVCNTQVENLTQHNRKHLDEDLKCKFCGKISTTGGNFIEHLHCHLKTRSFKCKMCCKAYTSERALKEHLNTHEKTPQELKNANFCEICNKKVRSLKLHSKIVHSMTVHSTSPVNKKIPKSLCNICGRQLQNSSRLKHHMLVHSNEYPYKCSHCERRFKRRFDATVHERIHTGEKPHVCSYCGKAFNQASSLSTHLKIHTGPPLQCHICPKSFCRPCDLRLHLKKHSGIKPFSCKDCGQTFGQRSHLVEHEKTHTKEKPFHCTHCNKSFGQAGSLKIHTMQMHSSERPFKCTFCDYKCVRSDRLTMHTKTHHKEKTVSQILS